MMREQLTDQLQALLAPLHGPTCGVKRTPDKLNLQQFKHARAEVWVGYHSKRSQLPQSNAGTQETELRFDCAVLTRSLYGPQGSLNLIDTLEELLVGRRLALGGPIYWVSDSYRDHQNGVWRYDVVVGLRLPSVPQFYVASDTTLGPALKYALLENDQDGDTSVGNDPDAP